MTRRALASFLAFLALAACGGAEQSVAPDGPAELLPRPLESGLTTVTYLGTLHERHYIAAYSLEVIETVVRRFAPDVVLVELPPGDVDAVCAQVDELGDDAGPTSLDNRWVKTLPELYRVVLPLRHELGYEVVGISGWSEAAMRDRAAYYAEHQHGPREREYIVANASFHASFLANDGWNDANWLHGDEYLQKLADATRWLSYFAEEEMGEGGPLRVQARHAALMEQALDEHPRQRVLVVFDITSRWALEPQLDLRSDVHRVAATAWLP